MADVARLLETMHPMREPPPPAPITPYVMMLAIGCFAALAILVSIWQLRRQRAALLSAAEAALAASRRLAPAERLAAQAALLRRLVRRLAGDTAARAEGRDWLARLDETFATRFFTEGEGAAYGDDLYRRPRAFDVEALDRTLAGLIARVQPPKAKPRTVETPKVDRPTVATS